MSTSNIEKELESYKNLVNLYKELLHKCNADYVRLGTNKIGCWFGGLYKDKVSTDEDKTPSIYSLECISDKMIQYNGIPVKDFMEGYQLFLAASSGLIDLTPLAFCVHDSNTGKPIKECPAGYKEEYERDSSLAIEHYQRSFLGI